MDVVAGLTEAELDELLEDVEWVELPGGEALFRQGEASDSFYVVVRGRLRALLTDETGEEVVTVAVAVDAVGELGLLTGGASLGHGRGGPRHGAGPVLGRRIEPRSSARRASPCRSRGSLRIG